MCWNSESCLSSGYITTPAEQSSEHAQVMLSLTLQPIPFRGTSHDDCWFMSSDRSAFSIGMCKLGVTRTVCFFMWPYTYIHIHTYMVASLSQTAL